MIVLLSSEPYWIALKKQNKTEHRNVKHNKVRESHRMNDKFKKKFIFCRKFQTWGNMDTVLGSFFVSNRSFQYMSQPKLNETQQQTTL